MKESFRTRLKRGDLLTGTLVSLPAPEVAEILAEAGFDWLFIDMEHSQLDPPAAQVILQAVDYRIDCVLRVALNDEIWIKKALDTGASGVIIPQVNSAEDARRAVRFCKYPPQGSRSVGLFRAQGYGVRLAEYLAEANSETAVIVQVEHIQAVENVEAIIAVEGVDAVLVGPYDLSASMDHMGQVEHPEVQAAIQRVRQVCQAQNMPLGIYAATAERARDYIQQGYRLAAVSSDTLMLGAEARDVLGRLSA
ncbi:MAG: aldolase/citrate lyase family protein [Anaerolineaceae bacterium]|jgi:2-keto-3-deoxy-L-rhamnonate aldolase RhmA